MHYRNIFLVHADNKEDALAQAHTLADRMCDEGSGSFDWYDDTEGRWPECNKPMLAESEEGKALIADAWSGQLEEYKRAYEKIAEFLKTSPTFDTFMQLESSEMIRYYMYTLGKYDGSGVYLYGDDGSGLMRQRDLDWYIKPEKAHEVPLYAVAIDMHS